MPRPPQPETPTPFWTNDRLTVVASLPCWDIVLSLYDGNEKTAAELARLTGRTPGALHAPLQRLLNSGVISSKVIDDGIKGRPPRSYQLVEGAYQKPCGSGAAYEESVHRATSSGLRLILRNSQELAEENARLAMNGEEPIPSERWVHYGNLNEKDLESVSNHFDAILKLLAKKRSGGGGKRYRVALMLLPDDLGEH
jgi:hypothetical protein